VRLAARLVGHAHAAMLLGRGAQQAQHLLVDHRHRARELERDALVHCAQPLLELEREDALHLGAGD
jgi:hypothetical protein